MENLLFMVSEELRKSSEVALTIGFLLEGGYSNRKDTVWMKYSNRTYVASLWREPTPTAHTQVVFHHYPLQATHAVVRIYKTAPFKRCSDLIVSIDRWDGDKEYYAFVPLSNLYYVQTIEPAYYDAFHILWASVDIDSLITAIESHDIEEAPNL